MEHQNIINLTGIVEKKRVNEAIQQQLDKTSLMYEGDFKRFKEFAEQRQLELTFETLEIYLLHTVETGLKLGTFNRRAAGVKHFLTNVLHLNETSEQKKRISLLRKMYDSPEYAEQKKLGGQVAQPQKEVIAMIEKLDEKLVKLHGKEKGEKLAIRAKAISMLNLITASRPSEMVTIRIRDIDLNNRSVQLYQQKQKEWKVKRLTLSTVMVVRAYIKEYNLQADDYFVGKVDKHNNYTSVEISTIAYRKNLHNWLGFAPYTLRKTQVSAMHEKGADLATIAKQSGHKNLETINKHYLSVTDRTVDKFLED